MQASTALTVIIQRQVEAQQPIRTHTLESLQQLMVEVLKLTPITLLTKVLQQLEGRKSNHLIN